MANNEIFKADDYDDVNNSQMIDAKETINQIIEGGVERAEIIVDIGCGSGNVTKLLASRIQHKKIYALDFDPCMVNYATQNYNTETIEYFEQDIGLAWADLDDKLKQLEGKVDLVWSNRVLHWVADKTNAVKTMCRLLKPGGRCYVNVSILRDLHEFYSESERKEAEIYIKCRPFQLELTELQNIFNDCGFSRVDANLFEKKYSYDSMEQFKKFSGGKNQGPVRSAVNRLEKSRAFDTLPDNEKEFLIQKYVEKYLKSLVTKFGVNPDGTNTEEMKTILYEQYRIVCIK